MIPDNKDEVLWQMARKRASFKRHLASYLATNAMLWAIWALTGGYKYDWYVPWPAWSTVFWGIALISNYFNTYHINSADSVEREYQKLKQNKNL